MPDEIVADVGIERAEIPAVAAALADGRPVAAVAGEAAEVEPGVPAPAQLSASVLAFIERSEEHTSELQSLMRISYAVFCLKKNNNEALHNRCTDRTTMTERNSDR